MGSATLAAAVPYTGKATRISRIPEKWLTQEKSEF